MNRYGYDVIREDELLDRALYAEAEVERLRKAIVEWDEAREAWAYREPREFPETAREMGISADEYVEQKLAWWAIGDRADRASGRLWMIAAEAREEHEGVVNSITIPPGTVFLCLECHTTSTGPGHECEEPSR